MTAKPPRCPRAASTIEYNLNRAATLLTEVTGCFEIGISPRDEDAPAEIALVQAITAAAQAHIRLAEAEAALHDCAGHR